MAESCEFIRDLIPVVVCGGASEETRAMVEAHIADCPTCKAEYDRCLHPAKKKEGKRKPLPVRLLLFLLKLLGAAALVLLGSYLSTSPYFGNVLPYYSSLLLFGAGVYTAFAFRRGRYAVVIGTPVAVFLNFYIFYGQVLVQRGSADFLRLFYEMGAITTAAAAAGLISGLLLRYALRRKTLRGTGKTWFQWLRSFVASKPLFLRIPAAVISIGLFATLCAFVFGLVGDPVSYLIAEGKMKEYLNKNYASYGYRYWFTMYAAPDTYVAMVQFPDNSQTFTITCFKLRTVNDNLQSVLQYSGSFNLELQRDSMVQKINAALADRPGYLYASLNSSRVPYSLLASLSAKQEIDSQTAADYLSVTLYSGGEFSPEGTALLLTGYYNELKSKGVVFFSYSLYITNEAQLVVGKVTGVTPKQIEGGGLTELLRAAKGCPKQSDPDVIAYQDGD